MSRMELYDIFFVVGQPPILQKMSLIIFFCYSLSTFDGRFLLSNAFILLLVHHHFEHHPSILFDASFIANVLFYNLFSFLFLNLTRLKLCLLHPPSNSGLLFYIFTSLHAPFDRSHASSDHTVLIHVPCSASTHTGNGFPYLTINSNSIFTHLCISDCPHPLSVNNPSLDFNR